MTCDICQILENRDSFKFIYEDDICFVIVHENPGIAGHSLVIPKKHSAILEELDDEIVEHIFVISNKVSSAIFETLGVHGTNIILNNGLAAGQDLPHVVVHVLPRKEGDNINFEWPAKKASDSELKSIQSMIQTYSEHIFSGRDELPQVEIKEEREEKKIEEDYMVKALKRMP